MPYYRFTGKELDPETGLYYYGARYYDPVLSRWISADPIFESYLTGKVNDGVYRPININLYRYTSNNPVRLIDPTGMSDEQPADDIEQLINDRQWQARNTQEGLKKVEPIAEALVGLNPGISAVEAISGESAIEGRELSGGERLLAVPLVGGFLKMLGRWLGFEKKAAKLLWGAWDDYEKVVVGENQYAKIGERLYTQHAVERMMPKGVTTLGRSISPNLIEEILQTVTPTHVMVKGVERQVFVSGSVEVVTEQAGKLIVTVNPFKH